MATWFVRLLPWCAHLALPAHKHANTTFFRTCYCLLGHVCCTPPYRHLPLPLPHAAHAHARLFCCRGICGAEVHGVRHGAIGYCSASAVVKHVAVCAQDITAHLLTYNTTPHSPPRTTTPTCRRTHRPRALPSFFIPAARRPAAPLPFAFSFTADARGTHTRIAELDGRLRLVGGS